MKKPCNCLPPLPRPQKGPSEYIPSKTYPDPLVGAPGYIPMHHGRGPCGCSPFVQVPDPNIRPPRPVPPPKPGPVPPEPSPECNCPPHIYRRTPAVVLEPGDNIELEIVETPEQTTYTINALEMEGATDKSDGEGGAVPAPKAGDQDKFLKGDGTWSEIVAPEQQQSDWAETDESKSTFIKNKPRVDVYVGPTSQSAAIPGFVPGATRAETEKFLRGDGTWATAITTVDQEVNPDSPNAVSGKAVAAALGSLDDKVTELFDSIKPVPIADVGNIVQLEPGDAVDPLAFDVPNQGG